MSKELQVMPNDLDLEKAVLGAILLESDAINSVVGIITNSKFFYHERNRMVWEAMVNLFNSNLPIDSATVFEKLKANRKSAGKDIALYITSLTNGIGSSANIETHATFLKEMYVKRRIIEISSIGQQNGYDDTFDAFDLYDGVLTELDALNNEINRAQVKQFAEIVEDKTSHLKEAAQNHSYITGVKTFLDDLDRVTLGFQPQDLIIIAGRPSMGKTALAIDLARKQAKGLDLPVAIFSLEMSASQLTDRLLSSDTQIPLENIRKGGLKFDEWQRFDRHVEEIKNYPIHICDKGGLSISEIYSISKSWKLKHGIGAIYVDYMQLISNNTLGKNANREQEISSISRRLKQLAKELNIPVVVLSQLSRACEARADKRPMLSDLRESGAIEQDADMVIFPFRPDYYDPNAEAGCCELIIAKNRNGKTGMVEVHYNLSNQLFSNKNF